MSSQTQSERDAEATRRLLAITGAPHPRVLVLLAVDCGAVQSDGLPYPGARWLPSDDPAWVRSPGGGCWTLGSGLVPIGLCEVAGLLERGGVGVPTVGVERARDAAVAWRVHLASALPDVVLAPEAWPERDEPGAPGRPLTRQEFLGAPRGAPLKLRVGEAWVDAEVLGHLGDGDGGPLHVGIRRGAEVVGYTLTWAECGQAVRVPAEAPGA